MQFIPTIRIDDVLQVDHFSRSQMDYMKKETPFEYFIECVGRLKGKRLKMAIVANGIEQQPEWVEMIKKEGWEVQCHCLYHHEMNKMTKEEAYEELKQAKEMIEDTFSQRVTQFFPPKHLWSPMLFEAARLLQISMIVDRWRPIHMEGGISIPEVYIHHWNRKNVDDAVKLCQHQLETI